jgi:hypothetical protein
MADVHNGVKYGNHQDGHTDRFVQVDVLVQWQEVGETFASEERDGTSQHQYQDEHAVKV